jgi:hypothetical protein
MPIENKCNDVDYQERVSEVMDMLLAGLRRKEILQTIAKHDEKQMQLNQPKECWNVTPSQIDNYIRDAKTEIFKPIEKDREKLKSKAHARYEYIFKKLLNVKDYKSAIIANEKICQLTGINEPNQLELTGRGGDAIQNSFTIKMVESGPPLANSEKQIDLD